MPIGMSRVRVGVCGFPTAQEQLFRDVDVLEVQHTFYQPPDIRTARRWRARAPNGFGFAVKAWQLITHAPTSPTYRKLREPLSIRDLARCGDLRLNPVTRMAWERTQAVAAALRARAIVLQTPTSFEPRSDNLRRLRRFLEAVDRRGRRIVFEPRGGAWTDRLLARLVDDLDLVHAVDPFLREPVGRGWRYYRLHGLPAYRYKYRYTDTELDRLAQRVQGERAWVLFNNSYMAEDARRLIERLRSALA